MFPERIMERNAITIMCLTERSSCINIRVLIHMETKHLSEILMGMGGMIF